MNLFRTVLNLIDPVRPEQSVPKLYRDASSTGEYWKRVSNLSTTRPNEHGAPCSARTCDRHRAWCVISTLHYFRVFRRHAALLLPRRHSRRGLDRSRGMPRKQIDLAVAIEELCLLLAPCLTTRSIGNMVQLTYDTPH